VVGNPKDFDHGQLGECVGILMNGLDEGKEVLKKIIRLSDGTLFVILSPG
jgi:hypothetical protein